MAPVGKIFLFCEGRLDALFLRNLLGTIRIEIQPLGSKYGFPDRIEGYKKSYGNNQTDNLSYLAIRDRNFDFPPPSSPQLITVNAGQNIFAFSRASVESYFIATEIIQQYQEHLKQSPKGAYPDPLPIKELEATMVEAAREIADYQAVRWGLASIKPSGQQYWPRLKSSWERDGELPRVLDFDGCLHEARKFFIDEYEKPTINMKWNTVEEKSHEYRDKFNKESFYSQQEYLTWFHGKDLLKSIFRRINTHFSRNLSIEAYTDWVIKNHNFDHNDLTELRQKCESLLDN